MDYSIRPLDMCLLEEAASEECRRERSSTQVRTKMCYSIKSDTLEGEADATC